MFIFLVVSESFWVQKDKRLPWGNTALHAACISCEVHIILRRGNYRHFNFQSACHIQKYYVVCKKLCCSI